MTVYERQRAYINRTANKAYLLLAVCMLAAFGLIVAGVVLTQIAVVLAAIPVAAVGGTWVVRWHRRASEQWRNIA